MITEADFPSLVGHLNDIFNEVGSSKVAEMKGNQIFGVSDTDWRTFTHQLIHGVDSIGEVTPGQDLPIASVNEGDQISATQRYFGGRFVVTKEMRKFDRYDQIEGLARSQTEGAFNKIDQSMADKLLFGTSTSYTDVWGTSVSAVGPDGLALFSASHAYNFGSQTFSNLINDGTNNNASLSMDALTHSRALAMVIKDPNGLIRPVNLDTVIVAPSQEALAERLILSDKLPGGPDNDLNPVRGKITKILTWERLQTRSDATDTSLYWFMADSSKVKESLQAKFAQRPELAAPEQVYANKNWEWSIDLFYALFHGHPAYVFGSTSANA